MGKNRVKVGLLGAGTIGAGVISLFERHCSSINEKIDLELVLARVADRDAQKLAATGLAAEKLTADARAVLDDPEIDIVIELIGGIEPARSFVTDSLKSGKFVVTANKDLLAAHGEELLNLARQKNVNIFYEASVGAAIPLIRPLKYSLVADRVRRIVGIVNGTTNYIFTRMDQENLTLAEALSEAQQKGFAEPDPTNDIEGLDAAYKLVILSGLSFGSAVTLDRVFVEGVGKVTHEDIVYAREIGYVVKLLAIGEQLPEGLALRVHPTLILQNHPLASVLNEFNAIFIETEAAGDLMFYGRGAGSLPTATAILADVAEAARCVGGQTPCRVIEKTSTKTEFVPIDQLNSRFYLRFLAEDRPGVFAALANAFGDEKVSLDMVIQKRRVNDSAEIVLVTHEVKEDAFQKALKCVLNLPVIKPNPSMIRLLS